MIFPLSAGDLFGYEASLVLGTLIGFGFGFALERGGFGRAPVLAAQFYLSDTRVLKVMFSAIVTAGLGLALLAGLGLLDLAALTIPETFLWPQLAGGFLLGVGFIVSGYCPGTAVVGAASGNVDGLFAILGVALGALVFGFAWPLVQPFYASGALGVVLLPDVLGVPHGLLAAGVFVMAVGAFLAAEKGERFFATRRGESPPPGDPRVRNRLFALLGGGAVLVLATLLLPVTPEAPAPPRRATPIDAVALAQLLVERPREVTVLDLRDPAACRRERIPGAICLPEQDLQGRFLLDLPPGQPLVVYGETDAPALPVPASRRQGPLLVLQGGYRLFQARILQAPTPPVGGGPAEIAEYGLRAALHQRFTGADPVPPPPAITPGTRPVVRPVKKGGGC